MRGFESKGGVIVPHIESADGTFIVISTQNLLTEQRIANLTDLLNIKAHLIRNFLLNAFRKMRFKNLLRKRADPVFVLTQQRKVFFIKPACDVMFSSSLTGGYLLPVVEQNSVFFRSQNPSPLSRQKGIFG